MSSSEPSLTCRHFVTYSGVRLPLRLVDPLDDGNLSHRNTFVRGYFDPAGRLVSCEKVVYGRVELSHRYDYDDRGVLRRAVVAPADGEALTLEFDASGKPAVQS